MAPQRRRQVLHVSTQAQRVDEHIVQVVGQSQQPVWLRSEDTTASLCNHVAKLSLRLSIEVRDAGRRSNTCNDEEQAISFVG